MSHLETLLQTDANSSAAAQFFSILSGPSFGVDLPTGLSSDGARIAGLVMVLHETNVTPAEVFHDSMIFRIGILRRDSMRMPGQGG